MTVRMVVAAFTFLIGAASADSPGPPVPESASPVIAITEEFPYVEADVTYATANNYDSKLDIYRARSPGKKATLVFFHGGGWMGGFSKTSYSLMFLPFLQLGWNVINVDYRPSSVSPAPAAVQDCLCAIRWIALNAEKYDVDLSRIVLMGNSAGGHLALMTGMVPLAPASPLSGPCGSRGYQLTMAPTPSIKPAAIVNWFGVTDLVDLYQGPNVKPYAAVWIGNQPQSDALAKLVSPINYVRADLPPIISIHGNQDTVVPYDHAVRLHAALDKHHVKNKLVTIAGGGHGSFGTDAARDAFEQVFRFLASQGLPTQIGSPSS
jgi:acetyl esterase/lipase